MNIEDVIVIVCKNRRLAEKVAKQLRWDDIELREAIILGREIENNNRPSGSESSCSDHQIELLLLGIPLEHTLQYMADINANRYLVLFKGEPPEMDRIKDMAYLQASLDITIHRNRL